VGLLDAQTAFVEHLVETAVSERVDVVVVSGDVFDRALPPVDAVEVAHGALRAFVAAGVRVVLSSGNHDSPARLGFAASLIDAAGIHLRTDAGAVGRPVMIQDEFGDVAIYAVPYLEPDLLRADWALPSRSHQAALDAAMGRVRGDLAARASGTRSVVLAHAFVAGARRCDSERDITVGGIDSVALDTFAGVDYVALGHLHGRAALAETVRYSGSPLAYSFSEAEHLKGSWLVEIGPHGFAGAEFVPAPVPRPLVRLRGSLESLLDDPRHAAAERAWVQATLTDAQRPRAAIERLQRRFPHALVLAYDGPDPSATHSAPTLMHAETMSDAEAIGRFFVDIAGRSITPDEAGLVQRACDECRVAVDATS
jgi:exonuclease SbcD